MMKFIQTNTRYPREAMEASISGTVYLRFVINTFGYIENVQVIKGIKDCPTCDAEAVRVVNLMPRWNAAKIKGKPVRTYFDLPASFKIM